MTDMAQLLTGKVALIIGGTCGTGSAISRLLIDQGATVIITGMQITEGQELAQELGQRGSYIYLDVADERGWQVISDAMREDHEGLDIFVYNSCVMHPVKWSIANTSIEDYKSMVNINLIGNFLGIRSVLPLMKNRSNASIINISSPDANGVAADPSSKWSNRNLSLTAANELRQYGIRVNTVHPRGMTTVRTGGDMKNISDQKREKTPLMQNSGIAEVANTVLFLASELSSYSTAGEYLVNGSILNQPPAEHTG